MKCKCGKEFFIVKQDWGRIECNKIPLKEYNCLNCELRKTILTAERHK